MNPGTITITGSALVLTQPSATEIQGVIATFKKLFKVKPVVRIKGYFGPEAVQGSGLDGLNLVNEFHNVKAVGTRWITIDLGKPLGTEQVEPNRGRQVEVRLTLP
jgi:hypothetical protein